MLINTIKMINMQFFFLYCTCVMLYPYKSYNKDGILSKGQQWPEISVSVEENSPLSACLSTFCYRVYQVSCSFRVTPSKTLSLFCIFWSICMSERRIIQDMLTMAPLHLVSQCQNHSF